MRGGGGDGVRGVHGRRRVAHIVLRPPRRPDDLGRVACLMRHLDAGVMRPYREVV
jgi:hypothetical protein